VYGVGFGEPSILRTVRLVLRQITESDGLGLFDIFSDDQVTEHYAWDTFSSLDQGHALAATTARKFRQGEALRWGLVPHGATRIIGTCGYTRWNQEHNFAVIGYDLASSYWRQGLMSEAVMAVLHFGFGQMRLNRVEATVMTGNTASAALLSRMGFQHEGDLRERALHRGTYRDVQMFGLTRAAWASAAGDTRGDGGTGDELGRCSSSTFLTSGA
jgi:ribosomal-protein-alanine N-acetyltransferase